VQFSSVLGEVYETTMYPDFLKFVDLILDMKLSFILNERNAIVQALSPENFYTLIANLNLIISEANVNKIIKKKMFKIGKTYKDIYEYQIKRKNRKFVKGEGASIKEYFLQEAKEFMELESELF
jgi:hypothetical protein